jgi:hypothetical protein
VGDLCVLPVISRFYTGCVEVADGVNPLNAKLNPICHLSALLGAHHILHVSRIRVNTARFKKIDSISCVYISLTIHDM